MEVIEGLFWSNVVCHALLLAGAVWCVALPGLPIYPMTLKVGVCCLMWPLFWFVLGSNFAMAPLGRNSGAWKSPLRFALGIPLALVGYELVSWRIATHGTRNTSALPGGLITSGPYAFTRAPPCVGDILLFTDVSIIANSGMALLAQILTSLEFLAAPRVEEPWLEGQYRAYRSRVARFL